MDTDTLLIEVEETGATVEVSRSTANEMVIGGFAHLVNPEAEAPADDEPQEQP